MRATFGFVFLSDTINAVGVRENPERFGVVEGNLEKKGGAYGSTLAFFWIASPSARNDVRGTSRNDVKGKTRMTGGERLSIT